MNQLINLGVLKEAPVRQQSDEEQRRGWIRKKRLLPPNLKKPLAGR